MRGLPRPLPPLPSSKRRQTLFPEGSVRGRPCTTRPLRATFRLDSPMKNPHANPFQTPSKLGHLSSPNAPKFRSPKLP